MNYTTITVGGNAIAKIDTDRLKRNKRDVVLDFPEEDRSAVIRFVNFVNDGALCIGDPRICSLETDIHEPYLRMLVGLRETNLSNEDARLVQLLDEFLGLRKEDGQSFEEWSRNLSIKTPTFESYVAVPLSQFENVFTNLNVDQNCIWFVWSVVLQPGQELYICLNNPRFPITDAEFDMYSIEEREALNAETVLVNFVIPDASSTQRFTLNNPFKFVTVYNEFIECNGFVVKVESATKDDTIISFKFSELLSLFERQNDYGF